MIKNSTIIGITVLFTLFFFDRTNAQTFINYTTATTSTKLCNNDVHAITIDAQGNKWFGTADWRIYEGGGLSKLMGLAGQTIPKQMGILAIWSMLLQLMKHVFLQTTEPFQEQ